MRNAAFWVVMVILVAGALSAVVSTATVQWLYPTRTHTADRVESKPQQPPQAEVPKTQVQAGTPPVAVAAAPVLPPVTQPDPAAPLGSEEQTALEFVRRAGAGDVPGALALAPQLDESTLRSVIVRLEAVPLRAARLPGARAQTSVLVWVNYRRAGATARGLYEVTVAGATVQSVKMLTPEGGFTALAFQPTDEQGRLVDMLPYRGKGLLLVTPRIPEPGLAEMLTALQTAFNPKGVAVVLVMDMRSPDWVAAARQGGYNGPVWRVKGRLEDVTLAGKANLLGAYGLLVDREGYAVAPMGALDPERYNLADQTTLQLAPAIFTAYGLLP